MHTGGFSRAPSVAGTFHLRVALPHLGPRPEVVGFSSLPEPASEFSSLHPPSNPTVSDAVTVSYHKQDKRQIKEGLPLLL